MSAPGDAGRDGLVEALVAAGAGKRKLPVVTDRDAIALTHAVHREIDAAVDMRARVAEANGKHIACGRGCNDCCNIVAVAFEAEVVAIVDWLEQPEHAGVRAAFADGFERWRRELGPALPAIHQAVTTGVGSLQEISSKRWSMCAFNRDGDCSIYPVRPTACRTHHALHDRAACAPNSEASPRLLSWQGMDDTLARHRPIVVGLQKSLRPGHAPEPVCSAVHRRLGAAAGARAAGTGRNDPCACGSGKKHKRCCGA